MRAMIMAAGKGTRLRPITDLVPKPMAPIVNRPALYHILRLLGILDYVRNRSLVGARLPTESEANHLHIRRSEPVLTVIGQNLTPGGEPLEVSESVFRADNLDLLFSFPSEGTHAE